MDNISKAKARNILLKNNDHTILATIIWDSLPDPITPESLFNANEFEFRIIRTMHLLGMLDKIESDFIIEYICKYTIKALVAYKNELAYEVDNYDFESEMFRTKGIPPIADLDPEKYKFTVKKLTIAHLYINDLSWFLLSIKRDTKDWSSVYYELMTYISEIEHFCPPSSNFRHGLWIHTWENLRRMI